ncbi:hypothetical protein TMatcc_010654 [Talaromyces marneffei ATCC 18224]|uniref:gamma-glutamylcyclotransferase n=2 Tax=Talaromyces marneffei TaxID=37727 RepID=B6QV09_TALMQ|nr:uncharacterized protein EYB26_009577 [Talaromyces marneffei]EEA18802.1 conserved hypothetical protein [Talaromyces marneffei ATCC 18224]QGA21866.1 hypothetical protein EYB26_009577 [Talaromyces marneffei]
MSSQPPQHKSIVAQDAIAEDSTTNRLSDHNETILQQQVTDKSNITNSQTLLSSFRARIFYFAYGSNLSPTQMRLRCEHDPETSGRPLAIARIDRWRWLICERGYANVIPPKEWRVGRQVSHGEMISVSSTGMDEENDVVFGILYEMTPEDEYLLDGYEGVDHSAPASQYGDTIPIAVRPREQEHGAYNKWYVPAKVIKWLVTKETDNEEDDITVLVYVDEKRVTVGPPKFEYVDRMNRAIRESLELGMPGKWMQSVMRKHIPES